MRAIAVSILSGKLRPYAREARSSMYGNSHHRTSRAAFRLCASISSFLAVISSVRRSASLICRKVSNRLYSCASTRHEGGRHRRGMSRRRLRKAAQRKFFTGQENQLWRRTYQMGVYLAKHDNTTTRQHGHSWRRPQPVMAMRVRNEAAHSVSLSTKLSTVRADTFGMHDRIVLTREGCVISLHQDTTYHSKNLLESKPPPCSSFTNFCLSLQPSCVLGEHDAKAQLEVCCSGLLPPPRRWWEHPGQVCST